jgi:hypothetical protein
MLDRYRRLGADPPFGDPRGYHGVAFEGYFWRLTHAATGAVVIALAGVNRDRAGATWATVGLGAHPGGFQRSAAVAHARAEPGGLGVWAGEDGRTVLEADAERLRVELPGARLDVRLSEAVPWPRRALGGIGPAQLVPGLSQYWHPHLLGGRVAGSATFDGHAVGLDGATAYAEKNWGRGGFPPAWWWGQAQGFAREDVCVAFAGGRAGLGPVRPTATALVVRVGETVLRAVRPLQPVRVEVGEHGWRLRARTGRHVVALEGHANGTAPHLLPVPLVEERRNLEGAARQHLAGEAHLTVHRGSRTVFEGTSALAGLEQGAC